MAVSRTQITPSPEARRLFGRMVARSDGAPDVGLARTIELSADLQEAGSAPAASEEVSELADAEWITPHPSGGWGFTGTD